MVRDDDGIDLRVDRRGALDRGVQQVFRADVLVADQFGQTDGIEAVAGNFGAAYPGGLFLAQDGDNAPAAQNFKLVRWDRIAAALGL